MVVGVNSEINNNNNKKNNNGSKGKEKLLVSPSTTTTGNSGSVKENGLRFRGTTSSTASNNNNDQHQPSEKLSQSLKKDISSTDTIVTNNQQKQKPLKTTNHKQPNQSQRQANNNKEEDIASWFKPVATKRNTLNDDKPTQGGLLPGERNIEQVRRDSDLDFIWDCSIAAILTLLACVTRLYKIGKSNKVVWDEAHFGKFGNYYLRREFYHDVHPPLGKMLVGLSGFLSGNNGTFHYESGSTYPGDVNYTFQRFFLAMFGISLIPMAFFTARNLNFSRKASLLVGSLVLFDNAFCVISRFILLDSMLLAFTALSFFFLTGFHQQQKRPFTLSWWVWLAGTGISIGLASSVKWVGLFVVALVGLYTIEDLYDKFGEYEMPKDEYLSHWVARLIFLIVVPFLVYMASFFIHFTILNHSGPGDSTMSSLFQARLVGSKIGRGPLKVAYGSRVTIKNNVYGGGLLHSHASLYPSGSQQHQITIYHHSDSNNNWIFLRDHEKTLQRQQLKLKNSNGSNLNEKKDDITDSQNTYLDVDEDLTEPVQFLNDGDIIRLIHEGTNANLHSHNVKAPMTDKDLEVSGYLNRTMGDTNDYWIIEIRDDISGNDNHDGSLQILSTRFRLRHMNLGCYLTATGNRLPPWGFSQGEVTCKKNINDLANALWNIEDHNNARLKDLPSGVTTLKSTFLRDFVHLNVAMWNTNNALIPDEDKDDILASQPYHWPLMMKGIRMCGWGDTDIKFYMMGNPLIWWLSTGSLLTVLVSLVYFLIRFKRKYKEWYQSEWYSYTHVVKMITLGYSLQYVPYYIMGRVMYVHHYFPALYFSTFAPAFLIDTFIFSRYPSPKIQSMIIGLITITVLASFIYFSPITFGMTFPAREAKYLDWLSSWKISDLNQS